MRRLLPSWAHPETDAAGNLVLHVGAAASGPRLVFVAHLDEIGYAVESLAADGWLVVTPRGGFRPEFFVGHSVFVHSAQGERPGILELPDGWDADAFAWPRDRATRVRLDVGARSAEEAKALGIAPKE